MNRFTVENVFHAFVYSLFFLPLLFLPSLWSPFESPKVFYFLFVIELLFPCYLYLIWKHPSHRPSFKNPFLLTLILFLILTSISALIGKDPWNSFFGNISRMDGIFLWAHFLLFLLYLQFLLQYNPNNQQRFIKIFLLVGGASALIGCVQAMGLIPFFSDLYGDRVTSTLGNPIFFAGTLLIPFFLSLFQVQKEQGRFWKPVYMGIAVITFVAIILTQTRGAFLGLIAGTVLWSVWWLFHTQKKYTKKQITIIIAIVIAISTILFVSIRSVAPLGSSLYRLTHFSGENASARLVFWHYALKGWLDAPWFGVGYQNFAAVADKYFESSAYMFDNAWPDKVHNMFLELLVTGGIFVFISYLALFGYAIRYAWQKRNPLNIALLAGLVGYITQNLFAFDTITSLQNIFFLFALLFAPSAQVQIKKNAPVPFWIWFSGIIPILFWIFGLFPVIFQTQEVESAHKLSDSDRKTGLQHIENVLQGTFIYDPAVLANNAEEIHHKELAAANAQTILSERAFKDSVAAYNIVLTQHPIRAKYWYLSSMVYYLNAVATKTPVPQIAIDHATKALAIAPGRVESLVALSNIENVNGNVEKATSLANQAVQRAPSDPESLWTLALLLAKKGAMDEAAPLGLASIKHALTLVNSDAINWIIDYYNKKRDTKTVVYLYEVSVKIEPKKLELLPKLAAAYAQDGQKEKAIETAKRLLQRAPESRPAVEAFIQSLP